MSGRLPCPGQGGHRRHAHLLLTVPNQRDIHHNAHAGEAILPHVAPGFELALTPRATAGSILPYLPPTSRTAGRSAAVRSGRTPSPYADGPDPNPKARGCDLLSRRPV